MVRHDLEEKDYVWKKKRRRSADTGKSKDRRRKVVDGIIVQDYDRRLEESPGTFTPSYLLQKAGKVFQIIIEFIILQLIRLQTVFFQIILAEIYKL